MDLLKLNHDSSWLIRYRDSTIVLDPWLLGSNIDGFSWFSKQDHTSPFLQPAQLIDIATNDGAEPVLIVSHQFTDHFSAETLEVLPETWKVYAEPKWAIGKVRGLGRFGSVTPIEEHIAGETISKATRYPLGNSGAFFSSAFFRATGLSDVLHNALLIALYPSKDAAEPEQSLVYCPHGIFRHTTEAMAAYLGKSVSVLICTISEYRIPAIFGGTLNLGLDAAAGIAAKLGAKALLDTHSENKTKEGLIGKLSAAVAPDHRTATQKLGGMGVKYFEVDEIGKWIKVA